MNSTNETSNVVAATPPEIELLATEEAKLWEEVKRIEELRKQALEVWCPVHERLRHLREREALKAELLTEIRNAETKS